MQTDVVEWKKTPRGLAPVLRRADGTEQDVTWAPQAGSQVSYLSCPITEVIYVGTRGPGKTDALIVSFLQHVRQGWGAEWKGIIFRRTYKELNDVIQKCNKLIPRIFPEARYNQSSRVWSWPTGETLTLSYFFRAADYWSYHGHSFTFIGWEELTTWPAPDCYLSMFSCLRSTVPGIPLLMRATTNPYGVGHNWVKKRWRLKGIPQHTVGPVIRDEVDENGDPMPERVYIHGKIEENLVLLHAQPNYLQNVRAAAHNPAELHAWLTGDWDITAGGMFDDIWDTATHMVPNFPFSEIPRSWRIDRSYDHGQSRPFSVGWWAESSGEPFEHNGRTYGTVRGDLYRIAEWYGWDGNNENVGVDMLAADIARGIRDREADMGLTSRVHPGPADSSIFDDFDKANVAADMAKLGITWEKADKSPGSRKQGWQQIRKYLKNAVGGRYREEPGLFVCERCDQFERCVPVMSRSDKDLDEVSEHAEDHIGDETRYRLRRIERTVASGAWH